jgi:hypothetical protein
MIHCTHNLEPVICDKEDEEVEEEQEAWLVYIEIDIGGIRGPKWKTLEDKCPIDS